MSIFLPPEAEEKFILQTKHLYICDNLVRPSSTSAIVPDFHTRKVIVSSLQNCCSEEVLSTMPWSFLSLLLSYKNVRNS